VPTRFSSLMASHPHTVLTVGGVHTRGAPTVTHCQPYVRLAVLLAFSPLGEYSVVYPSTVDNSIGPKTR
jgi:hypothetical protein